MFNLPEHFSVATKANVTAQLELFNTLATRAFNSAQEIIELNLKAAEEAAKESVQIAKQILEAKDAQEFFALTAGQAQPNAEKALAYGRHLATIASTAQAEFTKAAEEQIAETNRKVVFLMDEITKNAPAGSENVVAFVKSAIGNASAGYEQLSKTTKQTVEVLESNLNTAVTQFSQASNKASNRNGSASSSSSSNSKK